MGGSECEMPGYRRDYRDPGIKEDSARVSLKKVERELDDLHYQKRLDQDTIKNQQQQIKVLREEAEQEKQRLSNNVDYWRDQYESAYQAMQSETEKADLSVFKYFGTCALVLIAIGYAVWVG